MTINIGNIAKTMKGGSKMKGYSNKMSPRKAMAMGKKQPIKKAKIYGMPTPTGSIPKTSTFTNTPIRNRKGM